MEYIEYSSYFQILFQSLKYAGAWIEYGDSASKWYFVYFSVINIVFIFCGNASMAIFWLKNSNSIQSLAAIGYLVPITNMVIFKSYYLYKNKRIFRKLVTNLDRDIFKPQNVDELRIVKNTLNKWWKIRTTMMVVTLSSPISLILAPLFYQEKGELPFQAWFPIDMAISFKYEISYIYQAIFIMINAIVTIFTDVLVSGLCLFMSLLCDLLCTRLERIDTGLKIKEGREKFVNCIHLHTSILEFLETTDRVFGKIYFGQIFASTIAMCMDLFLLSLTKPSYEFFYLLLFIVAIGNLMLVPCWFATEMTRKSENIPNAAYNCNWIEATNSFGKDLTILIARSQRPLKLYAANYFEISVETFVKIVRSTLSYFAVLQNLSTTDRE